MSGRCARSGEALLSLVDDILDVAKVEAGKLELVRAPFDPAQLIETVCELMAPRAQEKGLEIAASIAPDLPAQADRRPRSPAPDPAEPRRQRRQVHRAGRRRHQPVARRGAMVEIAVADSGPGIPANRHAAIFEEFEQAETGASRSHAGTGLGLAIVSRLVTLMGGDDRGGQPPRCRRDLHRQPAARGRADVAPVLSLPDWSGRRILIAAAGPFGPAFLAQAIEAAGGEAICCDTAEPALAALARDARTSAPS